MTYEEAMQRLKEMESRFDDGFSSLDRMCLDSLYFTLFGREITNKGCSNCYRDAFIEISVKLKKTKAMPKKSEYVLKPGAIITFFGERQCYTNANMTDEAALRFLSQNPLNENLFEKLPADWKERVSNHVAANNDVANDAAEDEKDNLIATLSAENESLKQEIESLKAGATSKKRKSKADTKAKEEAPAPAPEAEAPAAEATAEAEPTAEDAAPVDNEVSIEETEEPVVEE
ncbi:MAG: hypothetical protein NC453_10560 [Muribaculum sp.]|nr:hypothetical protein [Muribaculum sp.]